MAQQGGLIDPLVSQLNPMAVAMRQKMEFFGWCALLASFFERLCDRA
ncbi:hypothetical protein RS9916_36807 [Synechococcus sp. RS9916]|nr:hypothetical protein RS9916_36807 [Synechococcus sp. RS9916]